MPFTKDRKHAESAADISVISLNAVQQSAKIAATGMEQEGGQEMRINIFVGEHLRAREYLHSIQRLLQQIITQNQDMPNYNTLCEEYSNYVTYSEDLDTELLNMQQRR